MKRDHLKIFALPSVVLSQNSAQLQHSLEGSGVQPDTFTSMLTNLVHSRQMASTARAVGAAFSLHTACLPCTMAINHLTAVLHVASHIPAFVGNGSDAPGILHCAICARGSSSVMTMTELQA